MKFGFFGTKTDSSQSSLLIVSGHGTVASDYDGIWREVDDGKMKGERNGLSSFLLPIIPRASLVDINCKTKRRLKTSQGPKELSIR